LYRKIFIPGSEVYTAIEKSMKPTEGVRVLVLGDSVANQLYNISDYNNEIYSLTCNQAISVVGQYLLLKNYIKNNITKGLKVYLIYHPESFSNNLDQNYTFNYFIKPFYAAENYSLYTNTVNNKVKDIPYYSSVVIPLIKMSLISPDFDPDLSFKVSHYENSTPIFKDKYLFSEISIEYLKKMKLLSEENKFGIKVVSPYLMSEYLEYEEKKYSKIITNNGLDEMFEDYFNFKVTDSDNFRDNYHYIDAKKFGENPLNF